MNNTPGFTAEASVYQSKSYAGRAVAVQSESEGGTVVPQFVCFISSSGSKCCCTSLGFCRCTGVGQLPM